jgi:excisionase family DNA binding protein
MTAILCFSSMTDSTFTNIPELLSVTQAAKQLGVTRQRVHNLIKNGQIIARKLGRFYYIEPAEIERYQHLPSGKPYQPRKTNTEANSIDN